MKNLILFIALCAFAHGQKDKPSMDVRTLALGIAKNVPERFLFTEEGYQKMSYSNRQASEIIKAYRNESLPLFVKASEPDTQSEYSIAERVKIPQNSKSILLLCWVTKEGKLRYHPINDSIKGAKYNDWIMINTTSKTVGFYIGRKKKPVVIKPNIIKNHKVTAEKGKGVPVVGRAQFDGKMKTFYSTYWKIRENQRSIVIFTEVGNKIKATNIGDRLVKPKEEASQPEG